VSADVATDAPPDVPQASTNVPALVVDHVTQTYRIRGRGHRKMIAVDDVSFTIAPGAAVGLVGASGSGKTTLARMITGSERPMSGSITFGDIAVQKLHASGLRRYHQRVQMIFQDPYGALNPLHTAEYTIARPCRNFLGMSAQQAHDRVYELLETVGLTPPEQFATKLPHQLSGGQRQRVVIARALACEPDVLIADEPVSMLDVSLRAGVLRLLASSSKVPPSRCCSIRKMPTPCNCSTRYRRRPGWPAPPEHPKPPEHRRRRQHPKPSQHEEIVDASASPARTQFVRLGCGHDDGGRRRRRAAGGRATGWSQRVWRSPWVGCFGRRRP
jgi:ABC-type dipeptide/oligopeptide/nickel transport system ATPase subunit